MSAIIPAIDLKDGHCVRLLKGDFEQVTTYSKEPADIARRFASMGADLLHVVDLDGARGGEQLNRSGVSSIIEATGMSVQLGGGLRNSASIEYWLDIGVQRCVIGSVAVEQPALIEDWLDAYSAERIVLALDVRIAADGSPYLATHGWTKTSNVLLWERLDQFCSSGLQHVLCTDISRDGALSGPNLGLYREITSRYPEIALQASGGVRHMLDIRESLAAGAIGAISGRALLDGEISPGEVESFLRDA